MRARVHAQGPADGTKDADKAFHSPDIIFGAKRDGAAPIVMRYPAVKPVLRLPPDDSARRNAPASSRRCVDQALRNADKAFHSPDIIFGTQRDGAASRVMRYPAVKPVYFAFRLTIRRGERPASSRRYVDQALRNRELRSDLSRAVALSQDICNPLEPYEWPIGP